MDTDLQPKKSSSPKRRLTNKNEVEQNILAGRHWPFERVDGNLLQKMHRDHVLNQEEALL